ncbi:MAG TPA: RNA methyltransferase substrate-binding domain-containing protein, partial [Candidatus Dormibacteraeota bacterium]
MEILYGKNPVLEALRAGRPARKLVLAAGVRDEPRLREILEGAAERGIPVEETSRRRLDDIAHTEHHQGIAGYFH